MSRIDEDIAAVRLLIEKRELPEAEQAAMAALRHEEDPVLYMLIGYLHQEAGRIEQTIEACSHARNLGLRDWSNELILGAALLSLECYLDARTALVRAHELAPTSRDASELLLQAMILLDGASAALPFYDTLLSVVTVDEADLIWRAAMINAIQKVIQRNGIDDAEVLGLQSLGVREDAEIYRLVSSLQEMNGRRVQALRSVTKAIRLGACDWDIYTRLGSLLNQSDEQ